MKKLSLILIAVFIVHIGFASKLAPPPPPIKVTNTHCTRTDSVENRCVPKEKATIKDATAPEKKKPHYRRIVLILV